MSHLLMDELGSVMKFLMDKQHFLISNHIIFPSLCSLMLIVFCCGAAVSKSRKEKLLIPKTSIRFLSMPWIQISLWSSVPVSQSEWRNLPPVFVSSGSTCECLLLLTCLQCGNTLQDEKLAVMQNLHLITLL